MTLHTCYMNSPIGWIELQATATHLCHACWVEQPVMQPAPATLLLQEAVRQLEEYFSGIRRQFDLPLQQSGTPFQQKIWEELLRIPYGERITYQELATRAGHPGACRAAGSANGCNGIFIIVPCHRVIQSGGKVGGYAYGTAMKQFLLDLES
ncbi:MAG: methylated-DNA--[protein]-cysteine S-methyltransferase [Tannerellaceae bacterium]